MYKIGDRVVRVSSANEFYRITFQHGTVVSVEGDHVVCKILTDLWRTMTFDKNGLDNFGWSLVKISDLKWLFDDSTYYWEVHKA